VHRALTVLRTPFACGKAQNKAVHDRLFRLYRRLHDAFGTTDFAENQFSVMKELLEIKRQTIRA